MDCDLDNPAKKKQKTLEVLEPIKEDYEMKYEGTTDPSIILGNMKELRKIVKEISDSIKDMEEELNLMLD
tara:strand:- start:306 stop:515 length:210 start_codon:yes stop_codon:yes gene_type:complete